MSEAIIKDASAVGEALVDAIGTVHRAVTPGETPRIVSLVPSVTELICDLGLAHWLVGRTAAR